MELSEVIATGMCPGHPTLIPPAPCSPLEYLLSHSIAPFGLIGIFSFAIYWGISVSPAYIGLSRAVLQWRAQRREGALLCGVLGAILSLFLFYSFYPIFFFASWEEWFVASSYAVEFALRWIKHNCARNLRFQVVSE